MMHFNEFRNVIVVESERAYYMGGGYPSDVLRRFGNLRVCSTDIADDKFKIVVKQNVFSKLFGARLSVARRG